MRTIKLTSLTSDGLLFTVFGIPLTAAAISTLGYLQARGDFSPGAMRLGIGLVCALVVLAFVVAVMRNLSPELRIDTEHVTLKRWSGTTVAQVSFSEVHATPGVFLDSIFGSDSLDETDSPMLTMDLQGRQVTITVWGGVSGWPRQPIVRKKPRYRVGKEDFVWLAKAFCSPAQLDD